MNTYSSQLGLNLPYLSIGAFEKKDEEDRKENSWDAFNKDIFFYS